MYGPLGPDTASDRAVRESVKRNRELDKAASLVLSALRVEIDPKDHRGPFQIIGFLVEGGKPKPPMPEL